MNGLGPGIQARFVFIAKYLLDIPSVGGVVLFGNGIGRGFATVFRFIAYRLWVFSEAVEADPATVRDREMLTGAIPRVGSDGAQRTEDEESHGPSEQEAALFHKYFTLIPDS